MYSSEIWSFFVLALLHQHKVITAIYRKELKAAETFLTLNGKLPKLKKLLCSLHKVYYFHRKSATNFTDSNVCQNLSKKLKMKWK